MLARKAIVSVIAILISYSMTWAAGPVVKTQPPCNTGGVCMGFGPSPFVVRSLSFTAPSSGQTIVTVNGSGFCQNSNLQSVQVAEFDSEIVSPPGANVSFAGPGGNKFKFTLPANSNTAITGNGVFNLSSERVFSIAAAQTQRYALKIGPVRLDSSVFCLVEDAALTVLFIPN